jgi:hypothetical protein
METTPTPKLTTVELLDALRNNPEARAAIASLYSKSQNSQRDADIAQRIWAGERYGVLAAEYGISVNRISQIMASRPNPNPQGRPNPNAERDRLILDEARKKVPRAEIARKHNLSVIRVNQIVGAAPKPKKLTFEERVAAAVRKYDSFAALTFAEECLAFFGKNEALARSIVQDYVDGMSQYQLEQKYPPSVVDDGIQWNGMHYISIAGMLYDYEKDEWIR